MSDADAHATDTDPALDDQHTASAHDPSPGAGHGHGHGHGEEEAAEPLGPPDFVAWGYALAGGAVGLITALALYVASRH